MDNEIKILIPKGYQIDIENSNFKEGIIKFKQKRWRDDDTQVIDGYFIGTTESEITRCPNIPNVPSNYNLFAEKKQAKAALAWARISQIMKHDKRFGGPVTDEEWKDFDWVKPAIERDGNKILLNTESTMYSPIAFHTYEQRQLFLQENEDLIRDYFMID